MPRGFSPLWMTPETPLWRNVWIRVNGAARLVSVEEAVEMIACGAAIEVETRKAKTISELANARIAVQTFRPPVFTGYPAWAADFVPEMLENRRGVYRPNIRPPEEDELRWAEERREAERLRAERRDRRIREEAEAAAERQRRARAEKERRLEARRLVEANDLWKKRSEAARKRIAAYTAEERERNRQKARKGQEEYRAWLEEKGRRIARGENIRDFSEIAIREVFESEVRRFNDRDRDGREVCRILTSRLPSLEDYDCAL